MYNQWVEVAVSPHDTKVSELSQRCFVSGFTEVGRKARVNGEAHISCSEHIIVVHPLGAMNDTFTLTRQIEGLPPVATLGGWSGLLDDVSAELRWKAEELECEEKDIARWIDEFNYIKQMCLKRMSAW